MFVEVNPNPNGIYVEDCVVRAICIATNRTWDDVYWDICIEGGIIKNMPSVNAVWGSYLKRIGFEVFQLPTNCPNCYTIRRFCKDNGKGTFILATGSHVVAVIDGDYYDTWNSGDEMPIHVWRRVE